MRPDETRRDEKWKEMSEDWDVKGLFLQRSCPHPVGYGTICFLLFFRLSCSKLPQLSASKRPDNGSESWNILQWQAPGREHPHSHWLPGRQGCCQRADGDHFTMGVTWKWWIQQRLPVESRIPWWGAWSFLVWSLRWCRLWICPTFFLSDLEEHPEYLKRRAKHSYITKFKLSN